MKKYTFLFLCQFALICGHLSVSAQTISNITLAYSCPCKVTATYTLNAAQPTTVQLYYSTDTVGYSSPGTTTGNWLPAETFPDRAPGTHTDFWDCAAAGVIYGQFYFKLVPVNNLPECVMINGVCWATRNVAAHGVFVDNPEDYGALFQWGRKGDGHEQRTSPSYPTNDDSFENGIVSGAANFDANDQIVSTHAAYGKFIKQNNSPYNWRDPSISTLWNSGSEAAPVKTANDPSPPGYRVPTDAEIQSLLNTTYVTNVWTTENGVAGRRFTDIATGNSIFLPAAGYRSDSDGTLSRVGTYGYYWSGTEYNASNAWTLGFSSSGVSRSYNRKALGFSFRPVAE